MGGTPAQNQGLKGANGKTVGVVGKNYVPGGGDMALSALAEMGRYKPGLIPAIITGIGSAMLQKKQAQAENDYVIQQENARRGGQSALGEMAGIDPRLLQEGLVGGDDATLKQALEQQGNLSAGKNANNMIQYLQGQNPQMGDVPQLEGNVPLSAQSSMLNNLWHYAEQLPQMQKEQLQAKIQEATMAGQISGTNAENQAKTQYAVPQAKATYQGKLLDNTGQGLQNQGYAIDNKYAPQEHQLSIQGKQLNNQGQAIDNRYAPQIKQGTINNQNANLQQIHANIQHKAAANALGLTLQKMQADNPDPKMFRGLGMDLLRKSNLPPEGIKAGMDSIDNMIIMKDEADKAHAMQQQKANPQQQRPGLFGIHF